VTDRILDYKGLPLFIREVEPQPGQPYWRIRKAVALNHKESHGIHNVYARCFRNGERVVGPRIWLSWPGGGVTGRTESKPLNEWGDWNAPMYGDWKPEEGPGPYTVAVLDGDHSEEFVGMGLPRKQHYSYIVEFEEVASGREQPATQPEAEPTATVTQGNILGPHINGQFQEQLDLLGRWRPRVALLLEPPAGIAKAIKTRSPGTALIGRIYRPDHEVEQRIGADPDLAAKWAAEAVFARVNDNPEVDAWVVANEVSQQTAEEVGRLSQFSIRFCQLLKARGLRGTIGGFGVGWPQVPHLNGEAVVRAFSPAMQWAAANDAWLAFHQYGAAPLQQPDPRYYILRWQTYILPWYRQNGIAIPRYVVTETGCDLGVLQGHSGDAGWRRGYNGNAAAYLKDLAWLAGELSKDERCIGATVFALGHNGDEKWRSFDIAGEVAEGLARQGPGTGTGQPSGSGLHQTLLQAGQTNQALKLNPQAALQKALLADGFVPTSEEFSVSYDGKSYVAQRAERLRDGAVRVYYCVSGDWGNVRYVERG
jgi:hypothetical protein